MVNRSLLWVNSNKVAGLWNDFVELKYHSLKVQQYPGVLWDERGKKLCN